jgi:hypothetical protein
MHGIIDPFYQPAPIGHPDDIDRGEMYEDQPVYMPARWGLRLSNFDPTEVRDPDLEVSGRTEDIFRNHPPLKRYNLRHNEAFVVGKAKWARPVLILARPGFDVFARPDIASASESFLCAPILGSDQYSEKLRQRIRAYEFPNLFYLPESKNPFFREGFLALDQMQAIHKNHLRNRKKIKLSDDALAALDEWLIFYVTGRLDRESLIRLYREEGLQKLNC